MNSKNQICLRLSSFSENVAVTRVTAAAFAARLDFTLNELEEIKVAVSEAVSNAIIHGYPDRQGTIELTITLNGNQAEFIIQDWGRGIADIAAARRPAYSSSPDRMGLGFVFMESFMDGLEVESAVHAGTSVRMLKIAGSGNVSGERHD